jgi:hypothetical protein
MSAPAKPTYLQSAICTILLLLLAVITFPLSLFLSLSIRLHGAISSPRRADVKGITVLVTGARTTKSLIVARILWKAGYRVILADEASWGFLSASRFSRCISRYYSLPDPVVNHAKYEERIRTIIARENVSLWIPGSSAGATVNDAQVAEVVREQDGVKAFIQSREEIERLHNKDLFGDLCKELGFTVPESVLVSTEQEAADFLHSTGRKGKEYILKTTALDDQGRSHSFVKRNTG